MGNSHGKNRSRRSPPSADPAAAKTNTTTTSDSSSATVKDVAGGDVLSVSTDGKTEATISAEAAQTTTSTAADETTESAVPEINPAQLLLDRLSNAAPSKETLAHLLGVLKRLGDEETTFEHGFSVDVPDEENLLCWHVQLFGFDESTQLAEDLAMYKEVTGKGTVEVEIRFPPDFPSSPPFLRIITPRFHQYTGHVTIGGSLCIEDLTRTGWKPENDLLTFIILLRNLLLEGNALVDTGSLQPYSAQEAAEAFVRVAGQHGWTP